MESESMPIEFNPPRRNASFVLYFKTTLNTENYLTANIVEYPKQNSKSKYILSRNIQTSEDKHLGCRIEKCIQKRVHRKIENSFSSVDLIRSTTFRSEFQLVCHYKSRRTRFQIGTDSLLTHLIPMLGNALIAIKVYILIDFDQLTQISSYRAVGVTGYNFIIAIWIQCCILPNSYH